MPDSVFLKTAFVNIRIEMRKALRRHAKELIPEYHFIVALRKNLYNISSVKYIGP